MIEVDGKPEFSFSWSTIPFYAMHVAALAVFFVPFSWEMVALCMGLYFVKMFAITAGFHRYLSHRSFKTSRVFQFLLIVTGMLTLQKGPLWWAAHHRQHHRASDREGDLHSPGLHGFLWAHMGWMLTTQHNKTDYDRIADFAKYPELRWLNKYDTVPGIALAVVLFLAGGWPAFVWGFLVSTVLTWHATFSINTFTHMWGRKRYKTPDDSRNSLILALITLGEGWHNNHHYYKSSTRQGFYWWEIDITYYILKMLSWAGIVWDLKEPPRKIRESNRVDRPDPVEVTDAAVQEG